MLCQKPYENRIPSKHYDPMVNTEQLYNGYKVDPWELEYPEFPALYVIWRNNIHNIIVLFCIICLYVHVFIFCFRRCVEIINRLIGGNKFTSEMYLIVSKHTDFYNLHVSNYEIVILYLYCSLQGFVTRGADIFFLGFYMPHEILPIFILRCALLFLFIF